MNSMNFRNGILTVMAFVSAILFPWPFTVLLVLAVSFFEPLVPFAVGLFADTLYYVPHSGAWPVAALYGLGLSAIAVLVRRRLRTGTIG